MEQRELQPLVPGIATTSGTWDRTAKLAQVDRDKAQPAPPDQNCNPEYDPLVEVEPMGVCPASIAEMWPAECMTQSRKNSCLARSQACTSRDNLYNSVNHDALWYKQTLLTLRIQNKVKQGIWSAQKQGIMWHFECTKEETIGNRKAILLEFRGNHTCKRIG